MDIITKTCPKCNREFPLTDEFWYKRSDRPGKYRSHCIQCINKRNNGYYIDNREKLLEKSKEWHVTNIEYHRSIVKRWSQNNPEKRRAIWNKWRDNNPESFRKSVKARESRRRARKKDAEGFCTHYHIQALYDFQEGRCFHCDCDISTGYHIDHWIPLSKGGSNWPENLRLLCSHCNQTKYNKLPWEWDSRYKPN